VTRDRLTLEGDPFRGAGELRVVEVCVLARPYALEAGGFPGHDQGTDVADQVLEDDGEEADAVLNAKLVPRAHQLKAAKVRGGDQAVQGFRVQFRRPFPVVRRRRQRRRPLRGGEAAIVVEEAQVAEEAVIDYRHAVHSGGEEGKDQVAGDRVDSEDGNAN